MEGEGGHDDCEGHWPHEKVKAQRRVNGNGQAKMKNESWQARMNEGEKRKKEDMERYDAETST